MYGVEEGVANKLTFTYNFRPTDSVKLPSLHPISATKFIFKTTKIILEIAVIMPRLRHNYVKSNALGQTSSEKGLITFY